MKSQIIKNNKNLFIILFVLFIILIILLIIYFLIPKKNYGLVTSTPKNIKIDFNNNAYEFLSKNKSYNGWILVDEERNNNTTNFGILKLINLEVKKSLNPVIIIPGLGGSVIYNKWNYDQTNINELKKEAGFYEHVCEKSHVYEQLWVNIQGALPNIFGASCWRYRMEPQYDKSKGGFINKNNIETNTWIQKPISKNILNLSDEFGGIKGVNILLELGPFKPKMGYMFYYIINDLIKNGYEEKKTLFGAPYDFRRISSKYYSDEYFSALKMMIEHSYTINNNQKVILLTHSLGCSVTKRFLSEYIPIFFNNNLQKIKEWKDKYIKIWIPINPPFGGSPKAFRTSLSGDDEGMGAICKIYGGCNYWYHLLERNLSGLVWMLPHKNIYSNYDIFTQKNVKNTKSPVEDISYLKEITKKAGSENVGIAYEDEIIEINETTYNPPMVNISVIVGVMAPTEMSYIYQSELKPDNPDPIQINTEDKVYDKLRKNTNKMQNEILNLNEDVRNSSYMKGDGTVPWLGLHVSKIWLNNTSEKNNKYYGVRGSFPNGNYYTNIQEFVGPEMEHKDIVNVPVVRKYILDIIIPNNNYNI
jgi:hypothetical protein